MSVDRVKQVVSHLSSGANKGRAALLRKSPDDVVITMAIRSPLCKAKKGAFKDTRSDELLYEMFKQAVARSTIDPSLIQDITVGTVLTEGAPYQARYAALAAGIPDTVPLQTVNRWCSSGLMAVTDIANKIRVGQIEIGLAVGFESMTDSPDRGGPPQSEVVKASQLARDAAMPMGWTSENVAEEFDISRNDMDEFAALSYQRAERADKEGIFAAEIVPFTAYAKDPSTGQRTTKIVTKDDGIRYGTTKENLMKIRPAFPQWGRGQTTGGNASQITDGAAAVLLMTRRKAEQLGLRILAKHVTTSVCGLAPRIMGIGPSIAIPMVLEATGLSKDDVDLFEINEAFASMYVYCVKKLGLDINKVNVHGGAIALGHPLGCTGARQIATGLNALARRNGKILVTSMCIGTGMGAAAVFVAE
ncbi:3-ketoacyl-CoA thiolase [Trametes punicea]|nr:3-ketoacyl-CoA thiolase [Trametes punicea]